MAPRRFLMLLFGPPSPSHGTPTPDCGGVHHVCSSSSHSVGSSMAFATPCGPCFPAPAGILLAGAAGCHVLSSRTPLAPRLCSCTGSYPSKNDGGYGGNGGGGGVGSFGGEPSGTFVPPGVYLAPVLCAFGLGVCGGSGCDASVGLTADQDWSDACVCALRALSSSTSAISLAFWSRSNITISFSNSLWSSRGSSLSRFSPLPFPVLFFILPSLCLPPPPVTPSLSLGGVLYLLSSNLLSRLSFLCSFLDAPLPLVPSSTGFADITDPSLDVSSPSEGTLGNSIGLAASS